MVGTATSEPSTYTSDSFERRSEAICRWPRSGAWATDWDDHADRAHAGRAHADRSNEADRGDRIHEADPADRGDPARSPPAPFSEFTMRTRLTVAILCVVAATLLLTSVGSYVLVHRAANSTGQQELVSQAQAVSKTLSAGAPLTGVGLRRELRVIKDAGDFSDIRLVRLFPDGTVTTALPQGIDVAQLHVPSLLAGNQVTGKSGNLIYSAIPTPVRTVTRFTPVLVITRVAHNPANGIRYFLFVAAGVLVLAAIVAWALGRRFSRPLEAAVGATRRIADGDLDVTVPTATRDDPEFRQLADAINAMASGLSRARDQERQFLLSVSHELRAPLTSIRGYADAVIDGATDDPVAAASVLSSEARRLA